jgi:3-hydroxyisobutyrate dehydrogenase-like beta-hydroxyacid dehydrogenase
MEIGFLGLGSMGLPMARNLMKTGHRVTVWNRDRSKAQPLEAEGAAVAATPAKAVKAGGVAITMLADDAALAAVVEGPDGILKGLGNGLHISMSTVSPSINQRLAKAHAAHGGALVAAPVFGRPDAAATAKLNIPCSGPAAARIRALPYLQVLGQRVESFGEDPGAANLVKLCGNYLLFALTQSVAEALATAEAGGLDREAVMGFFTSTNFNCPAYAVYGGRVASEDYAEGGFKMSLAHKDLRLFSAQPGAQGLPLRALLERNFDAAHAKGWDGLDVTALARLLGTAKA